MKDKECKSNFGLLITRSRKAVIFTMAAILLLNVFNIFEVFSQTANESLTYEQAISAYKRLDSIYAEARMFTYGKTDCGEPLHLFVISSSQVFDPYVLHENKKCILFINNGIHPGEPDGIDASVRLASELLSKPLYHRMLENVAICIIPVFNIDGALERGCCSRVNQNGPAEYGFRANAKNLDLNRDFVKSDARNTKSLISIFRKWDPDVFVDTHVSDGADYQYTMTLIAGQHDKLSPAIGSFMHDTFVPSLFSAMKDKGDEMSPYVDTYKETPDSGIVAFMETPRFLGGYQSLFDCFTFTTETHMLKPFPQRVNSTFNLLNSFVEFCSDKSSEILSARKKAAGENNLLFNYNWTLDTTQSEEIHFKGYKAEYSKSKITNGKRLSYNRSKPYEKNIKYYEHFIPADTILIPQFIVIPQAWEEITLRLEQNGVKSIRVNEDSSTQATVYFIDDYQTSKKPYEGHYLHYNVKLRKESQSIHIRKGDYLVPFPQQNMRYALEVLIPNAVDSYLCWGFFDSMLQQKEGFSDYVFEDIADSLLQHNPQLKSDFKEWQSKNPNADEYEQLGFIYKRSVYFEKSFMRYPVAFLY